MPAFISVLEAALKERIDLSFEGLRKSYAGGTSPEQVVATILKRIESSPHSSAWIHVEPAARLMATCRSLAKRPASELPLFGIPFGVKDNIDVAGMPTTAACPDFSYTPDRSARCVERLLDAGAICIGKTNLDQFATGLSGARSPYGTCASIGNPLYVSGGSSSGSALAVAAGQASFSLGTDTGGSGRIPAGFNGIVGIKPTVGRISTHGLVANCRSLDCVSIFSNTVSDGSAVLEILTAYDADNPFSRLSPSIPSRSVVPRHFRFGRLGFDQIECFGMGECAELYEQGCHRLLALGGEPIIVDAAPLIEAGQMLFIGPWIAERCSALDSFGLKSESFLDIIRNVIRTADKFSAADAFRAQHRLATIKREIEQMFAPLQILVLPTAPRPFTIEAMDADPVNLNNQIGHYSYAANLLDLCGLAVPNGVLANGVPMGLTFYAPAWCDEMLAHYGERFEAATISPQVVAVAG
jgi:amidase/allophanate hydrolase